MGGLRKRGASAGLFPARLSSSAGRCGRCADSGRWRRKLLAAGEVPKPQNVLSPDAAWERLKQGNQRYVDGGMLQQDFAAERKSVAGGQNPFAGILSCADSRVAPELAFDAGLGDLFIVRVAGNFLATDGLASFRNYALDKQWDLVGLRHENEDRAERDDANADH